MKRIAVIPTAVEAYSFVFSKFGQFISIGFIPAVIYCGLYGPVDKANQEFAKGAGTALAEGDGAGFIALVLYAFSLVFVQAWVLAPMMVAWSRLIILGRIQYYGMGIPILGSGVARYAMFYFLLEALYMVSNACLEYFFPSSDDINTTQFLLSDFITLGIHLIFIGFAIWVYIRIAFLFVEFAIDVQNDFRVRWSLTKGHALRLFYVTMLTWPPWISYLIFQEIVLTEEGATWPYATYFESFASLVSEIIFISAVSIAYRDLVNSATNISAD